MTGSGATWTVIEASTFSQIDDYERIFAPNFVGANLSMADISRSSFQHCNFQGANLFNTNVSNTDFSYANFTDADLRALDIHLSILHGATLSNTTTDDEPRVSAAPEDDSPPAPTLGDDSKYLRPVDHTRQRQTILGRTDYFGFTDDEDDEDLTDLN
jgi:hypothetical protein